MKKVHAVVFAFLMMTMSLAGCLSGDAGEDGSEGPAGADGKDGVDGQDGADGLDGANGQDGADGLDGANGQDGADGSSSPDTMLTSVSSPNISMGCTEGGRIISNGLDNGDGEGTAQNGILEEGEIDYRTTYCSKYELSLIDEINNMNISIVNSRQHYIVDDAIYFVAYDDSGIYGAELWVYETSTGKVWMVEDINYGDNVWSTSPIIIFVDGDTIYMQADDGVNGKELWAFNKFTRNLWLVGDINSGLGSSNPGSYGMEMIVGDTFYFVADDGISGRELWAVQTGEEENEPWRVEDIRVGTGHSSPGFYWSHLINDKIYFTAEDGNTGQELWVHDTSNNITSQLADINPGASDSINTDCRNSIVVDNQIYFCAYNGTSYEIWVHDTSNSTTWQLTNICENSCNSRAGKYMMELVGNSIYFSAVKNQTTVDLWVGYEDSELWAHNISNSTTWQVADIHTSNENEGSYPGQYLSLMVGDTIYFSAQDGLTGSELWAHDTSNHSTWQVADINNGIYGGIGYGQEIVNDGRIYFVADDGISGREIWVHDTTNHSTWQLVDLRGSSSGISSNYYNLLINGDDLYFIGSGDLYVLKIKHTITYD